MVDCRLRFTVFAIRIELTKNKKAPTCVGAFEQKVEIHLV
jgi:hypothetical protein